MAATDKDIRGMIKEGTFRDDLYYRLNVVTLYMPPLRERKEDIPLLVDYFIQLINQEFRKNILGVTRDVMDRFVEYSWPGNVAELEKILLRAASVAKEQTLIEGDFPDFIAEIETRKAESMDLEVVDGPTRGGPGGAAIHGPQARQASRPAGVPPGFADRGHPRSSASDRTLPARQVPCRSEPLEAPPHGFRP